MSRRAGDALEIPEGLEIPDALEIRDGRLEDLESLNALYNHYVEHTAITFDLDPVSERQRREWFRHFSLEGPHRLLVATGGGLGVRGFACSTRFRAKAAYSTSVETTIYLHPEAAGAGLGRRLYGALFAALEGEDLHRAYAGIALPNPASIALHRSFGFREIGIFREVGCKHGRYWDVEWFEKQLS